jgi:hypothetical protein
LVDYIYTGVWRCSLHYIELFLLFSMFIMLLVGFLVLIAYHGYISYTLVMGLVSIIHYSILLVEVAYDLVIGMCCR